VTGNVRPLAAAVKSSPRVLLFLFGSKDELVLALLRGALIDLLATGDVERTTRAVRRGLTDGLLRA